MLYKDRGAAKINLALDVLRKRSDGYHDVEMIMQTVSLYDTITIKPTKADIKITSNSSIIPVDDTNIVYKTAEYLRIKYNVKAGADIHIDKSIPVAAGLAGGSTNAGTTLKLLNKAWDLRLTKDELLEAGKRLGADVPFCMLGGTALAEGLGDKLTPLLDIPECYILLAKPSVSISTKEVYQNLKLEEINRRPDIKKLMDNIKNKDIHGISENLCNVLEIVTMKMCPHITDIKQRLVELGAIGSLMSGSGPTVFGVFTDLAAAYNAHDDMKHKVSEIFVVKTVDGGDE